MDKKLTESLSPEQRLQAQAAIQKVENDRLNIELQTLQHQLPLAEQDY